MSLNLRPIQPEDEDFLYRLYASTRQDELAILDWDEAEKEAFLRLQFTAQHAFYMEQFAGAAFDLIEQDGKPIGRLYLDRRDDEIRIIDIALLPEHRYQGIGSRFMTHILDEGQRRQLPVRIHVETNNPAMRLYHRLGFRQIETNGVYWLMEWSPKQPPGGI